MPSTDPATRLVVDLVAGRPPTTRDVDWGRVVHRLETLGLQGLAVSAHRSGPFLPGPVARVLEPAYLSAALHTTLTVESARRALEVLERADVAALVYKGAALVESGVYPDPGARAMDDADLLVPVERAEDAVRALRSEGFEPWVEWDPRTVEWLDSATFRDSRAPRGADVDVDLHWRLGYGGLRYGQDGEGERAEEGGEAWLWEDADGSRHLPAGAAHLVVIAEHVLKHFHVRVHLPGVLDLVRLSAEIDDWEGVERRLARHPGGRSLSVLLDVMRRAFGAPIPERVGAAGSAAATRLARRLLTPEALLERASGGGRRLRGLFFRWLLAGSVRRALGEVRTTVLPGSRWLRARYGAGPGRGRAYPLGLLLRYWTEVGRWLLGRGVSPVSPNQEFER